MVLNSKIIYQNVKIFSFLRKPKILLILKLYSAFGRPHTSTHEKTELDHTRIHPPRLNPPEQLTRYKIKIPPKITKKINQKLKESGQANHHH